VTIHRPLLHPRAVLLVCGVFFITLTLAVLLAGASPLDVAARDAILSLESPAIVAAMRVVNYGGSRWFLVPATLLLFVVFPRARARWWLWVGLMLAAPAAEGVLKFLVGRSRPEETSMGFPSGHATAAAAFFGAVMYLAGSLPPPACRLVRALAVLCILLVAMARVILRAHWPSDALGGIALGLALAAAAALVACLPTPARPPQS
jgi:undecaprenyl-diphosphatase